MRVSPYVATVFGERCVTAMYKQGGRPIAACDAPLTYTSPQQRAAGWLPAVEASAAATVQAKWRTQSEMWGWRERPAESRMPCGGARAPAAPGFFF
ncbi:hypothetical protein HPB50_015217 [Hyalomma asiaticum]|uniref:Uncharacterized protein n=1 Tax=Hyalomma asiaticum TaxID=266040 RepID=A0ACB7SM61_HYAAI|nr:hypothetical protein HPB50_015217 [Hyalomma asiaticum]